VPRSAPFVLARSERSEWSRSNAFEEKGVIKRIEPRKLLEATHFSTTSGKEDKPENYQLVTWRLQDQGKSTVLVVTQDGIANAQGIEGAKKNWQAVLQTLKKVVEGDNSAAPARTRAYRTSSSTLMRPLINRGRIRYLLCR
jgi:hypothetical protein